MKVNYRFDYKRMNETGGNVYSVIIPVEVTPETDADSMYETILSFFKDQKIQGKPFYAHSMLEQFPSYCFTSTDEILTDGTYKPDNGRRVWCRIEPIDETIPKGITTWIPGIEQSDGTISSAIGLLSDPEFDDDIRPFDDCPFPGYTIQKIQKEKADSCPALCTVKAVVSYKNKRFLYNVNVATDYKYSVVTQKEFLKNKIRKMIYGECSVGILQYEFFDAFYKEKEFTYTDEYLNKFQTYSDINKFEFFILHVLIKSNNVVKLAIPKENGITPLRSLSLLSLESEISKVYKNNWMKILEINELNGSIENVPVVLPTA